MVRWRLCLFLALLLILPEQASLKGNDDDDEEPETEQKRPGVKRRKPFTSSRVEEGEEEENDEDDDDEDDAPPSQRLESPIVGRRAPATFLSPTPAVEIITRTVPRRPLECYVCAYKAETQLRSCLDPTKYRVHTMICHSSEDKCFTSVISKGNTYEAIMRGCRSGCVPSPETTCCELNRCNNQALTVSLPVPRVHTLVEKSVKLSKCNKTIPPSVLFFVTILLVLQTVVKVAFV